MTSEKKAFVSAPKFSILTVVKPFFTFHFLLFMKKIYLLFALAIGFQACQKDELEVPESNQAIEHAEVDPDEAGYQVAKNLALAINDAGVRSFIREQAITTFDGDYDVLLAKAQHDMISTDNARESKSFGTVLAGNEPNSKKKGLNLDKILAENPLLQIAVPELPEASAEGWDTQKHLPIVIYRPPGVDLNKVKSLPAFDNEGNVFEFDITKTPTEPILVVSHNERLTVVPKGKAGIAGKNSMLSCPDMQAYHQDASFEYYLTSEYYNCDDPYSSDPGDGGGGTTTSCDRDKKATKDHVKKLRFASIEYFRKAEHYVDGNPEVYFVVTFGAKESNGFTTLRKYIASKDRSHWKDCGAFSCTPEWYNESRNGIPLPVFDWDMGFFGDRVRYDWFEEDFSTTKSEYTAGLTVGFKDSGVNVSGQGKWTINAKDYILGQDIVNYCDNTDGEGTLYTTGALEWYVNQQ